MCGNFDSVWPALFGLFKSALRAAGLEANECAPLVFTVVTAVQRLQLVCWNEDSLIYETKLHRSYGTETRLSGESGV